MTMALRPMRWWDVAACARIDAEAFPDSSWSQETFWGELARVPQSRYYVVMVEADEPDDESVVGYGGIAAIPPEADVQTIALASQARGQGFGRLLLTDLLAETTRRECTSVMLEVAADNEAAIGLYESEGFERLSHRRDYYAPGRDALIMRRRVHG